MAKKKNRSASSGKWLREHFDDVWVKKAQKEGYRSRACYKLKELQDKDRLIRPGVTVVDLGSAPGGWSQVAVECVGNKGRVIASDILPMDTLAGVEFVEGDFTEDEVLDQILDLIGSEGADLVISDMAPNMSGTVAIDQPRSMLLVEMALDMAVRVLHPGGTFVTKVFHGEGFEPFLKDLRSQFERVVTRKPAASRPRSREVYLVAKGFKA